MSENNASGEQDDTALWQMSLVQSSYGVGSVLIVELLGELFGSNPLSTAESAAFGVLYVALFLAEGLIARWGSRGVLG